LEKSKGSDKYVRYSRSEQPGTVIFKHAISTVTTAKIASAPPPPPPVPQTAATTTTERYLMESADIGRTRALDGTEGIGQHLRVPA
jgi:hypothetical protein